MLAFFPKLYEDELLYSWFARYHLRSCNISPKATMKDLFGSSDILAVPDLPTHLDKFYLQIKNFNVPKVEIWIKRHTFYNYYTVFAKEGIKHQVFNAMIFGNKPGAIHMITGMMASSISEPVHFRFCPECVIEDIDKLGETYWHISHQLPGVFLCLKHSVLLQNASVLFRGKNKHTYVAASEQNCRTNSKLIEYNEKTIRHLNDIALDISKVSQGDFDFTWEGIQNSYRYMLQKHGYATFNGTVHQKELAEDFRKFYGDELLEVLQSPVEFNRPSCWLKAITRKHRKAFHPIRHILFMRFFKEDIETFYQYANKTYNPFGLAPYPCMNAAADHYLQPVVPNVKVTICSDTRKPVGTFACSCGFVYSRRGPDQSPKDLYKIGRIKKFGPVWEEKLTQLIHVEKMSYYATAQILNVDVNTVKKYANKGNNATPLRTSNEPKILYEKQRQWLELKSKNPALSRTQLRKINPGLYTWLYRHAHLWLNENSPDKQIFSPANKRADWDKRDKELVIEIREAVNRLYVAKKPVYINTSTIGKEIGKLALLERYLSKLPLTEAYLRQVLETREQFQIRRVQWAAKQLFEFDGKVYEWKIYRLAGLRTSVSDNVKKEIEIQVKKYLLADYERRQV